jgi:hypothetical protein
MCYYTITKKRDMEEQTMATYARYNFTVGWEASKIGEGWHLVTNEKTMRTPSGVHQYITINGVSVKARHCEVVQVFTK